jgi:hypothetical protein
MKVRYTFEDDSRTKEGQLAREGYVHVVMIEGSHEECTEVSKWCDDNIKEGWMSFNGSKPNIQDRTRTCFLKMYFKSCQEVFHLRLTWG